MDFPKLPHCSGLSARALLMLLDGRKITHRDYQSITASYRLSARIYELKEIGWLVDDHWEQDLTNDPAGRVARFKRYWLNPKLMF